MEQLPVLAAVGTIQDRLPRIFPEGTPHRAPCIWDIAARTVFVMLYVGAVEGHDRWLRPDQVTRMTDQDAERDSSDARHEWALGSVRSSRGEIPGRWYAVNTRESIRDDTIRSGLIPNGAVVERLGLPTTSPAPRYALQKDFAALFNPDLSGMALASAIAQWQQKHLSAAALARVALRRQGATASETHVVVSFPNGETRRMEPGPSSAISKAVIEEFAPNFLADPAVVFLSESAHKVVQRDDSLAKSIGIEIQAERNLPDILMADLGAPQPLLIFVEVVATDGPITEQRKNALLELTNAARFPVEQVVFLTAFADRSENAFKKSVDSLAWGSFVWFASEPSNLLIFSQGTVSERTKLFSWL